MPQYIIWICCIIVILPPPSIALAVFHLHMHTVQSHTHTQMQDFFLRTVFDDETLVHCRSQIEKENERKMEEVQTLSLGCVLSVKRSVIVTSQDNTHRDSPDESKVNTCTPSPALANACAQYQQSARVRREVGAAGHEGDKSKMSHHCFAGRMEGRL